MRVAIAGCGQLARMLALAGIPLGVKFSFLIEEQDQGHTPCVDGLGNIVVFDKNESPEDLHARLGKPDVLTFEKEQIDIEPLAGLESVVAMHPNLNAMATCQNRRHEKSLLESLNIPTANYFYATSRDRVQWAYEQLGSPVVVKSTTDGYDGKAQWQVRDNESLNAIPEDALARGVIVEKWVPFQREVSLVGARNAQGDCVFYPVAENVHKNGILVQSVAPAENLPDDDQQQLQGNLRKIMDTLDYVGVLAMECFVTETEILVNELAPRVHNSGHWTQDGAVTCQFENHVRAITNTALGSTQCHGVAGMLNLLGTDTPPIAALTDVSTLHWYNKLPKVGRKQGHINILANTRSELAEQIERVENALKG